MNIPFLRITRALLCNTIIVLSLSWCANTTQSPNAEPSESKTSPHSETLPESEHGLSELDAARRRVALRSIIRKGDYYSARNDANTAIEYYEKAYEKIQEDPKIALRLANSYLEVKNFRKAADIFIKFNLSNFDEAAKLKVIASIMYDETRENTKEIIHDLSLTEGTKAYLYLIDDCTKKPAECVELIQSNQSTDYRIQSLRETIQSAKGTSDDELYIRALLIGKLFEQKSYLAAKKIGAGILEMRPNYKVVLKIVGYSNYELWHYTEAAKDLEQYYTLVPEDVEVAYMLGIVNYYESDYSTSNLYFNSAVLNGYMPKTELERRLVYNYVLLGDTAGAFKIFRFLLDEPDVLAEDYHIALFTAEQAKEHSKVSLWSRKWMQKFPDDPIILAYAGMASMRMQDIEEARLYLLRAYQLNPKEPLVSLYLAKFYLQKQEYKEARDYLVEAIAIDQWGYFAEESQKLLAQIPTNGTWSNTPTGATSPVLDKGTPNSSNTVSSP